MDNNKLASLLSSVATIQLIMIVAKCLSLSLSLSLSHSRTIRFNEYFVCVCVCVCFQSRWVSILMVDDDWYYWNVSLFARRLWINNLIKLVECDHLNVVTRCLVDQSIWCVGNRQFESLTNKIDLIPIVQCTSTYILTGKRANVCKHGIRECKLIFAGNYCH